VPKNHNKFGFGAPVPVKEAKDVKSYSPFHSNRPPQSNNATMQPGSNQYLPSRPISQLSGQPVSINKTLTNTQGKNLMMGAPGQG
jgi:hypothetical protein